MAFDDDKKQNRVPHNYEAEKAVIGYLLYYNDNFDEVFTELSTDMLYDERLKIVYSSIFDLRTDGTYIDKITVQSKALEVKEAYLQNLRNIRKTANEKSGVKEDSLNDEFFDELLDSATSESLVSLRAHVDIIKNTYIARKAIECANDIIYECQREGSSSISICNKAQDDFYRLAYRSGDKSYKKIADFIPEIFEDIDKGFRSKNGITGVASGFGNLDAYTGGFQPSDMIILAGRPGMGKTTFALNLAYNISENYKNVLFFSLEMGGSQLVKRILSALSFVSSDRMRTGKLTDKELELLVQNATEISKKHFYIYDNTLLTIADLRNECMKAKTKENGLDVVFIDYLQLMKAGENYKGARSGYMPRQEEVAEISRNIKSLAKELKIPIIALSQLNRDADAKERPQLSDLRESGAIEQDADMVLIINKPKDKNEEQEGIESDKTDIIIAKHRNGSTGTINLRFDKNTTRFTEWDSRTQI